MPISSLENERILTPKIISLGARAASLLLRTAAQTLIEIQLFPKWRMLEVSLEIIITSPIVGLKRLQEEQSYRLGSFTLLQCSFWQTPKETHLYLLPRVFGPSCACYFDSYCSECCIVGRSHQERRAPKLQEQRKMSESELSETKCFFLSVSLHRSGIKIMSMEYWKLFRRRRRMTMLMFFDFLCLLRINESCSHQARTPFWHFLTFYMRHNDYLDFFTSIMATHKH